jgi:RimJ/RimL family protein N-acetyltransferase
MDEVSLRPVSQADLPVLFRHQRDPVANQMAAFTAEAPNDESAFTDHWGKILGDPAIIKRTVLYQGQVAGYVLLFDLLGKPSVGYWLGREFWGKGIATRALGQFLRIVSLRPLYARVAKDNHASIRVLEKCGFGICGEEKGFAPARGKEIDELVLSLPCP